MPAHSEAQYDLFQQRVDTLYRTDAGRLVSVNDSGRRPAPRFHLMRTAAGPVFRCRVDLPDDLVRRLGALSGREPLDRFSERRPAHHDRYIELLAEHMPPANVAAGPAYMSLSDVSPARATTAVRGDNADLLRRWFRDWLPDVPRAQPFVAVVEDGHAVSLCASVRISAAVHCAGVETHPDYRGRGYASDVVAAWARAVRALGAAPFYSTSWDNIASQRVAKRLGLILAGVDFHIT